ncbi:MAG: hypothetical protein K5795_03045 [Lachnospiraceae bacterium]|nr:hypothetical protein [Lachnospiraceae bacterium]
MQAYIYLVLCISVNLIACTLLTASDGLRKPLHSAAGIILGVLSYFFFAKASVYMNISIAYSMFAGIGIIASALISTFVFKQKLTKTGVVCAGLIAAGIVYIHMFGTI